MTILVDFKKIHRELKNVYPYHVNDYDKQRLAHELLPSLLCLWDVALRLWFDWSRIADSEKVPFATQDNDPNVRLAICKQILAERRKDKDLANAEIIALETFLNDPDKATETSKCDRVARKEINQPLRLAKKKP